MRLSKKVKHREQNRSFSNWSRVLSKQIQYRVSFFLPTSYTRSLTSSVYPSKDNSNIVTQKLFFSLAVKSPCIWLLLYFRCPLWIFVWMCYHCIRSIICWFIFRLHKNVPLTLYAQVLHTFIPRICLDQGTIFHWLFSPNWLVNSYFYYKCNMW